jgi:hypothetical protein
MHQRGQSRLQTIAFTELGLEVESERRAGKHARPEQQHARKARPAWSAAEIEQDGCRRSHA